MKIFKIFGILIIALIGAWAIWWHLLPFKINRYSDIELGENVIANIKRYKTVTNKLPKSGDWETLKKLGFESRDVGTNPSYANRDDSLFEIVFLEGFDGPYLLWNSSKGNWEIDQPTIFNPDYAVKVQIFS